MNPHGRRRDRPHHRLRPRAHRPGADDSHRPAGPRRCGRALRPLLAHALAGAHAGRPLHRPHSVDHRPARAGRLVPAAAGDHRGQPRRQHRLGHLLPGHRREGRDLRDRELHPGDRAAHRHDAPQRDRRAGAREDAHLARRDQRPAARRARRGDRQVGHPRQPRRAEGHRPAGLDPGLDGEADARRPGEAGHDPPGGGRAAVADPPGRGPEAVGDPPGRGREAGCRPACRGSGEGDRDRLRGDPRGQARRRAARVPVPPDAPADRAGRVEQGLDHPERAAADGREGRGHDQGSRCQRRLRRRRTGRSPSRVLPPWRNVRRRWRTNGGSSSTRPCASSRARGSTRAASATSPRRRASRTGSSTTTSVEGRGARGGVPRELERPRSRGSRASRRPTSRPPTSSATSRRSSCAPGSICPTSCAS